MPVKHAMPPIASDAGSPNEVAQLASRTGRSMLASGCDAARTLTRMEAVIGPFGQHVTRLVTLNPIAANPRADDAPRTRFGRHPGSVHGPARAGRARMQPALAAPPECSISNP